MARFFYRLLGLTAWRAARWYVGRRYKAGRLAFTALAALVALASRRRRRPV
jgi:MYXO-CTERM domain-containing protein